MEKVDARTQTREQLQERRAHVIRLHQQGVPVMQIVDKTGLSWSTVDAAIKRFKADGESMPMPAARGRKPGSGRILTKEQEAETRQLIRMRRPWFYKLKDSLWSRDAVTQLIKNKFGVNLSARGLGNCGGQVISDTSIGC